MRLAYVIAVAATGCLDVAADECTWGETVCRDGNIFECDDDGNLAGRSGCCAADETCVQTQNADGTHRRAACSTTGFPDARCEGVDYRRICVGSMLLMCQWGFSSDEIQCADMCLVDSDGIAACAVAATDARCAGFTNPTSRGCDGDVLYECHDGILVYERSCAALGATCRPGEFELAYCGLGAGTDPRCGSWPFALCDGNRALSCTPDGAMAIDPCDANETCRSPGDHAAWCQTSPVCSW